MRVKHASVVMGRSLAGRPAWQQAGLGLLRAASSLLRWVACSPLWPWLGAVVRDGALRLERWVHRL